MHDNNNSRAKVDVFNETNTPSSDEDIAGIRFFQKIKESKHKCVKRVTVYTDDGTALRQYSITVFYHCPQQALKSR